MRKLVILVAVIALVAFGIAVAKDDVIYAVSSPESTVAETTSESTPAKTTKSTKKSKSTSRSTEPHEEPTEPSTEDTIEPSFIVEPDPEPIYTIEPSDFDEEPIYTIEPPEFGKPITPIEPTDFGEEPIYTIEPPEFRQEPKNTVEDPDDGITGEPAFEETDEIGYI